MNKKALLILPRDTLGGAEKVLKTIAIELSKKGYSVDVVFLIESRDGGWDDIHEQVNLIFSKYTRERQAYLYIINKVRDLSKSPYDFTVASNTGINGLLGLMRKIGWLKTEKLIARESTQIMDRFKGIKRFIFSQLYRWGYGTQDLVIYQTNYMQDRLEAVLPYAMKWRTEVIPNPINSKDVLTRSTEQVSLPTDRKYILGVGRLIPLKGFDLLINTLPNLPDDMDIIIVGNGSEKENLIASAKQKGVSHRVHLMGYQSNPYPYMRQATVGVISSRVEGFPNTLLQMMSVNERLVSTLCAGDIDTLSGVVTCPTDNVLKLTQAIKTAIEISDFEAKNNRNDFDLELDSRRPEIFIEKILTA
jgi:glycosyltransferase involved in cell wall biosynthesis